MARQVIHSNVTMPEPMLSNNADREAHGETRRYSQRELRAARDRNGVPATAHEMIHSQPAPENARTKQLERHRVQMKALSPVMALPTISVFISRVPS
jgi:hypothetical protein